MCIVFCFRSSGAIGPYQLKSLAMSFPGWKAPSPLGVFDWRKALHLSTSISSISAARVASLASEFGQGLPGLARVYGGYNCSG